MKNLFQATAVEEIEQRIAALKPDSHANRRGAGG
jgi:hypothetical protein